MFGLTHSNPMLDSGEIEQLQRMTHEDIKISSFLKGVRDRLMMGEKYSQSKLDIFDEIINEIMLRCFDKQ